MIYAYGMHGRFRLGYGAQDMHVAAAMAEDRAEIDELVAGGADPDARDAGGCAPLHYAADNNSVGEVARALFDAGADPEAREGYGRKPLDYAISSSNAAFIEAALDAGADPPAAVTPLKKPATRRATAVPRSGKRTPTSA